MYLVVRERVQNKVAFIEPIESKLMLANPLAKGLPTKFFYELYYAHGLGNKFVSFGLIKCSICDHIMKIKFLILMFIMLFLNIDLVHNSYV